MELAKDWRTRPHAAPARGDADRARQDVRRSCCRAPAISSSPTMASSASARAGRTRWRGREALARHTDLDARAIAEKAMAIAGDICIYTNEHRRRRAVELSCRGHLPSGDDADARPTRSRRARSSPSSTSTSSGRRRPSAPWRSRCATACAGRSWRPSWPRRSRPKNILMIGPTGVGKTEIARRLARLAQSPFLKVEASKFTEVGYVGRDVESMVRDLVELAVEMVREERLEEVRGEGACRTPRSGCSTSCCRRRARSAPDEDAESAARDQQQQTRERLREQLRAGRLDAPGRRNRRAREVVPVVRDHRRLVGRGSRRQPQGHAAGPVPGQDARSGA